MSDINIKQWKISELLHILGRIWAQTFKSHQEISPITHKWQAKQEGEKEQRTDLIQKKQSIDLHIQTENWEKQQNHEESSLKREKQKLFLDP